MNFRAIRIGLLAILFVAPGASMGQDFKLFNRNFQVHGFATQGFVYTNDNNWLTMGTANSGSGAWTDAGLNLSTQVTDHLRFGGQMYLRHLGDLSNGTPQLDWAFADYRIAPWLGFRGGKVKTTLGLYNDTQDLDSLQVFALLPQAIYPIDLRSATIAHEGGDAYGNVHIRKGGQIGYTVYGGLKPTSVDDGFMFALKGLGDTLSYYQGPMFGGDIRWYLPVKGLLAGASWMNQHPIGDGFTARRIAFRSDSVKNQTTQFYVEEAWGKLKVDGEYRRLIRDQDYTGGLRLAVTYDNRSWYVGSTYQVLKRLAIGGYRGQYIANWKTLHSLPSNHIYDWVPAARYDFNSHWYAKVEGHFMDGAASLANARGFYGTENPKGLAPTTKGLVAKAGFSF